MAGRFEAAMYGTVMRGMPHHHRIAGAEYLGDARTRPEYRLVAVGGQYPLLLDAPENGGAITVEVFVVTAEMWQGKVDREPEGLQEGRALLEDGRAVTVMLGDLTWISARDDIEDITRFGGWRAYMGGRGGL